VSYENYYAAGTATVANGSAAVTGTDTAWATMLVHGGMFIAAGLSVPIASVEGDGALTLAAPWPGSSLDEDPYQIGLVSSDAATALWANRQLAQVIARAVGSMIASRYTYGIELVERDAFDGERAGFAFVLVEPGDGDPVVYIKETDASGDWSPAKPWRGPAGEDGEPGGSLDWQEGGWVTDTAYTVNQALPHDGASYRCHSEHTSGAASEPGTGVDWQDYWTLIAAQGEPGPEGPAGPAGETGATGQRGVIWRGPWDSGDTYAIAELVSDDDSLGDPAVWIAVAANSNSRPRDNPTDWHFFPGSFPEVVDDGLWDDPAETEIDDGVWGA
jgi:hypothetical protein